MQGAGGKFGAGPKPAECLVGLDLGNGWHVKAMVRPSPAATGGHFSVGYLVESDSGRIGFLKALDFIEALRRPNFTDALQEMTAAYNFERDVALKCGQTNRVVSVLAHGSVRVSGSFGDLGNVAYIIFEKAEGDIRAELAKHKDFDLCWCLRSLHHAALGMNQLHLKGVAHQDMKPSNVFWFMDDGFKIGDFGRSSDQALPSANDLFSVPGDASYAPPEQLYGFRVTGDFTDRCAADLYLLGSLFFFFFLKVSATHLLRFCVGKLGSGAILSGDFSADVVILQRGFGDALGHLEDELRKSGFRDLAGRIVRVVGEMCDPDPRTRGNRKVKLPCRRKYDIQRYASLINDITQRAELGML